MEIGKAFSFVQDDREAWIAKILLGGIILIIPFVGIFAVLGYMLRIAERVASDHPEPLPAWGEFGDLIVKGLYYTVINLAYQIPLLVLMGLFFCVVSLGASTAESDAAGAMIGIIACLIVPLMIVLSLGGAALGAVATARYVVTGRLAEAFEVTKIFQHLRANLGLWVLVLVTNILAGVVGSVGFIACGFGVLFTYFYAYCVMGHALGQVAKTMRGEVSAVPITTQL
jgi:Protein of unknown function (DUF4013)